MEIVFMEKTTRIFWVLFYNMKIYLVNHLIILLKVSLKVKSEAICLIH